MSNASLELPGLTCTIMVEPSTMADVIQTYRVDGTRLRVQAKGASRCNLTSVGGGVPSMSWDIDVNVPVFASR